MSSTTPRLRAPRGCTGISPKTKLVAFALVLAAVVVTWNVLVVAALAVVLAAGVVSAGLRSRLAFGLAAYPALFALIFAFASAPDALTGAVIMLKAVSAALAAVIVVLTTPYPQVFAPVQRIVPGVVGDALLMTYRATFLLLDKFSNLLRSMRLRAGLSGTHPLQTRAGHDPSFGRAATLLVRPVPARLRHHAAARVRDAASSRPAEKRSPARRCSPARPLPRSSWARARFGVSPGRP